MDFSVGDIVVVSYDITAPSFYEKDRFVETGAKGRVMSVFDKPLSDYPYLYIEWFEPWHWPNPEAEWPTTWFALESNSAFQIYEHLRREDP